MNICPGERILSNGECEPTILEFSETPVKYSADIVFLDSVRIQYA